jgi:gliding motility-associated-like protein
MKKKPTGLWGCLLLFLLLGSSSFKLFAQPRAAFSANIVSGCSPIVVNFKDQSTGSPAQWRWDLGNGVISFLQNPSTTYFNPGTYTVKLVVRNASGSDSIIKNQFITVYANPVINFKISDSAGCFPLHAQFTDLSMAGSGTITSWSWDFGDGSVSTLANPSHVYTSAGNFAVTLRITNSFGCVKTFSKTNYIQVGNGVKADFINTSAGQCTAPVTINFTNTSVGPGSLNYTWNFGDGISSNLSNPVHTYSNPGSYTVSLVTVSPQGCRDTMIKQNLISIGTITSQFISPDSVCVGSAFTITNATSPVPGSVLWNFGDGTTLTQINPVKTYTSPGIYTIKLLNNFGGCVDSVNKHIVVKPKPTAAFSSDATMSCKIPFIVEFLDQSSGSISWQWQFGDGGTSTEQNPEHAYTSTGNFTVRLIATNANGCSDTIIKQQYIQIERPSILIHELPQKGCLPLTINPSAAVNANQPIASYLWNFGDGTTTNAINPTHTYTTAGNYDVSLTITTTGGCAETTIVTNAVRVGKKPTAMFSANPTDVCAFHPVQFTDKSSGNIDQWFWQFGDGGTSVQQNPLYAYQDTGYFSVTLVAWSNTCADTITLNNIVHIKPPIARFTVNASCIDKYKRDFVDNSIGATSWLWNFGDGNTSSLQNPLHVYNALGTYTVSLTVSNGVCTHSTQQAINIVNEKANFIADNDTVCKNSPVNFSSININAANISTWQWNFGDGSSATTTSSASHAYTAAGEYTVSLIITDVLGCNDTMSTNITVNGATAFFSSNVQSACIGNGNVLFTDASSTDGVHPIVKKIWNYGDGVIDSASSPPYAHLYTIAGNYNVSLTVTDAYGCSDIFTSPSAIVIAQPKADFNSPDTNSCIGKPINFINTSSGSNLQYNWQFGDGLQSTTMNPVHQYSIIGLYTVSLQVTDQYGCKDSITRNNYIAISFPHASFTVSDSVSTCPPMLANFTNSSVSYTSLIWDFGDGNTSTLISPSHYYISPGVYIAKLTITGPGGCVDTMSKRIEVRGPRGSFSYTPQIGCNPTTVTFTATTLNRISFIWDFSDGTTVATTDSIISHVYTSPGEYVPKMILIDASGCNLPVIGNDTIKVIGIDTGFQPDIFQLCDSGYVNFQNYTVSNDLITDYTWNFGDGSSGNSQQPSHQYTQSGIYSVQLTVTTQSGCTSSLTLNNTIKVFSSPIISIQGDTSACVPAILNFSGQVIRGNTNSLNWHWNFGNGQSSSVQNPAGQSYNVAANYMVNSVVIDDHGCKDSVSRAVSIHPSPNTNAGDDAKLCKGSSVQLNATGASFYSWNPSAGLSCSNCANPFVSPADTAVYVVTGISQFGCIKIDSVKINVRKPFVLNVSPDDSLCLGEFTHLSASGADQYRWIPSTGLDNPSSASTKAIPSATTLYKVIAKDNDNCFTDTASVLVTVSPLPSVEAGKDITVVAGSFDQLHATGSNDITNWSWSPQYQLSCFDCPDPKVIPKQTTTYTIKVKNAAGCISKDNLTVFVTCNNGNLFIPNTFSPNGDGMNDKFYPRGTGIGIIRSFRVFNRWGELVFEKMNSNANDAAAGWDGVYKGKKLSPDVFVYTCEVVCDNNQVLLFKGDVTLIQ